MGQAWNGRVLLRIDVRALCTACFWSAAMVCLSLLGVWRLTMWCCGAAVSLQLNEPKTEKRVIFPGGHCGPSSHHW